MNENEKKQGKQKGIIFGIIAGVLILYIFSNLSVNKKINYINQSLVEKINTELKETRDTAQLVIRNDVNEQVESFLVNSCSNTDKIKYEQLLSSLNGELSNSSLQELNQLFNYCGYRDVEKRSLMTLQLKQSVDKLALFNTLGKETLGKDLVSDLEDWQSFLKKEEEVNKNFIKLVEIQREIILSLLNGEKNDSLILEGLKQRAGEIRGEMDLATVAISELQTKLFKDE